MRQESKISIALNVAREINQSPNDQGLLYQFSEGSRAVDNKDILIISAGAGAAAVGMALFFLGNIVGERIGIGGAVLGAGTLVMSSAVVCLRNPVGFRNRIIRTYTDQELN